MVNRYPLTYADQDSCERGISIDEHAVAVAPALSVITSERVLKVDGVSISYGNTQVLDTVSFSISRGEVVALIGPSGCGKSTLLKCLMGLLAISSGTVKSVTTTSKLAKWPFSMVFQDPRLLPWMTVIDNVTYPLIGVGMPKRECIARGAELLHVVGLADAAKLYPSQLSGGMKQRANLARALIIEPLVLLLDEPFASADAQTRERMQRDLLQIWAEQTQTAIFVTHQIDEALYIADRVLLLGGTPAQLQFEIGVPFERPRDLSVKRSPEFHALEDALFEQLGKFSKLSVE